MKRKLPPLNAIKAFEASARYLSFTKAAEELCVTQGAISRQIKLLEDYLGVSLFQRLSKNLVMTEEAKIYSKDIGAAFDSIQIATDKISSRLIDDDMLIINALPSFSSYWLTPNIQDFTKKYPGINIRIVTGDDLVTDFSGMNADVAIRIGNHPFANVENYKIMDEHMLLVCSPELIAGKDFTIESINQYPLLEHIGLPVVWDQWKKEIGIDITLRKRTLGLEHFFMLLEAVRQGYGFAFIPDFIVRKELQAGRLINPLNIIHKTKLNYYLLYPERIRNLKKIQLFCKWFTDLHNHYLTQSRNSL